jgi:hypothetical protein
VKTREVQPRSAPAIFRLFDRVAVEQVLISTALHQKGPEPIAHLNSTLLSVAPAIVDPFGVDVHFSTLAQQAELSNIHFPHYRYDHFDLRAETKTPTPQCEVGARLCF